MKFFRRQTKKCEIPFCSGPAVRTVKIGNDVHHLCKKHFGQTNMPLEMKRKIDNYWLTEEHKRRMFNLTKEDRAIIEYLVQKGILENHYWRRKTSYKPTARAIIVTTQQDSQGSLYVLIKFLKDFFRIRAL